MSEQTDPNMNDVVFYVDDLEDDFTFYLDVVSHKTIEEFKELFDPVGLDDDEKKRFSLSRPITFTNLTPNENSPAIGDALWTRLRSATDDAGRYLFGKFKSVATPDEEKLLEEILASRPLSVETQKKVAKLLVRALSPQNRNDIREQDWLPALRTADEEKNWEKLEQGDSRRFTRYLFEIAFPELVWKKEIGRALICFSHVGEYLSVTVRKLKGKIGYEPDVGTQEQRKKFLFYVSEYCAPIYEEIFGGTDSGDSPHGLLVVTGPTKSLKSEITRGLIHLNLQERKLKMQASKKKGRSPHLVTFEDPIEMFYARDEVVVGNLRVSLGLGGEINYTPRQKQKDAGFLRDALADALRQTPAVFFVGETRSKEEWEVLLDFAATGHLIVTTAHAGSLIEAMRKIFEARGVETAADRAEIGNKLLAVVNLKPGKIETEGDDSTEVVFPTLWRRTSRGVASLTSDGLSSLLPHRKITGGPSCLGRRWFIEDLIGRVQGDLDQVFGSSVLASMKTKAYKKTTNWDLQGG